MAPASGAAPTRVPVSIALAMLAALALTAPARAQFGPDLRLTGPASIVSQTAPGHAWSVASDDQDNLHVIYFDARGGPADVAPFYRRFDQVSATWSAEERLPSFANAQCRYVAIAADPLGQVHVLWIHTVPGDQHYLYYKRRSAAGTWSADLLLQNRAFDPYDMRDPSVAADYQGNTFAVWAEGTKNGAGQHVYNVLYKVQDGATSVWSGSSPLTNYSFLGDPPPGARAPSVAAHFRVLGSGTIAHVAWADYNAGAVRFRNIRRLPTSITLRGAGPVSFPGAVGPPSVATRCGEVHVVWADPAGAQTVEYRHGFMTSVLAETTFFEAPSPTGLSGQTPNVAVDGLCNLHLAMVDGGAVVHARRDWLDGSWSTPAPVSDPGAIPTDVSIASDTHGSVHLAWADARVSPPGSGGAYYDRGACVSSAAPPAVARPTLSPALIAARTMAPPGERIPVLIEMRGRADVGGLKRGVLSLRAPERRSRVIATLKAAAGRVQSGVLAELFAARSAGAAARVRSLWLANAVAAEVSPATLDRLATRPDIAAIVYDPPSSKLLEESFARPAPARRADAVARAGAARPARVAGATPAWSVNWIGAPTVWGQGYLGACVLVAIIDTGIDYTHPDLATRIWTNGGEIGGNAIDDDGNGFVDDVHGYDFSAEDGDPMDANGHGTHVGGTVAGDGANGTITGVAPEARVMAVKVLSPSGSGSNGDILAGIDYAVDNGAQVLNLSLGELCPDAPTRALYRASGDAVEATGVIMCVAAGNDRNKVRPPNMTRTPGDVPPPFISGDQPALGATSGVTTVGATGNNSDLLAHFTSQGPVDWSQPAGAGDWLLCDPGTPNVGLIKPDISAPGLDVISCLIGGGYGNNSGTSMATPHVAGLAALMLSKNYELTSNQVQQILEATALDLGVPGKDNDFGTGRIRAPEAIAATPAAVAPPMAFFSNTNLDTIPPSDGDHRLEPGETAALRVTLQNGGPFLLGDVSGQLSDDSPWVTIDDGVASFGEIPPGELRHNGSNPFRITIDPATPPGHVVHFSVAVSATGGCGVVTFADTVYDEVVAVGPGEAPLPALALYEVAPDPAIERATFAFAMREEGRVRLALFDVHGRRVRTLVDGSRPAGVHRVTWDGHDDRGAAAAAGIYLARIERVGGGGLHAQRKFAWLGR